MICEKLIIKRFLEIFNSENGTNFCLENCIKKDELPNYRRIKTYDYDCKDLKNKIKMGIEIKRLIPQERERIINLNTRVINIKKQLKGNLNGNFLLVIGFHAFNYRQNRTLRKIFNDIHEEILSLGNKIPTGKGIKLSCCEGVAFTKWSEESDFDLRLLPISLDSASPREIKKTLIDALEKFKTDSNIERINIILLVELSSIAQRTEIANYIEDLEFGFDVDGNYTKGKKDFSIIDEIYHIAISKNSTIAQAYPEQKEFGFFPSIDIKNSQILNELCLDYFLH